MLVRTDHGRKDLANETQPSTTPRIQQDEIEAVAESFNDLMTSMLEDGVTKREEVAEGIVVLTYSFREMVRSWARRYEDSPLGQLDLSVFSFGWWEDMLERLPPGADAHHTVIGRVRGAKVDEEYLALSPAERGPWIERRLAERRMRDEQTDESADLCRLLPDLCTQLHNLQPGVAGTCGLPRVVGE